MAISPIETAAFLPKSQEASFQKQTEVQKPVNDQALLNVSMQQKEKADSSRTTMLTKSDEPEYRYDGSSKNGQGMLYKKPTPKKEKKKQQMGTDQSNQGFDMRI